MGTIAININGLGEIVDMSGEIIPLELIKVDVGYYELYGTLGLAKEGWKTAIYKDENGENTIKTSFDFVDGKLIIQTFDMATNTPKDIEHLLTLRLDIESTKEDIEI